MIKNIQFKIEWIGKFNGWVRRALMNNELDISIEENKEAIEYGENRGDFKTVSSHP